MPRQSPDWIVLSAAEKRTLTAREAQYTRPYFEGLRAKMILLATEGWSNEATARSVRTRREVVSLWRKCFFETVSPGWRTTRAVSVPGLFPPEVVVTGKALACELPTRGPAPAGDCASWPPKPSEPGW